MNEGSFEGIGGLKIATKSWTPVGDPRGVMILIHGFNAHSGYMEWPAEQFAAKGLAVYALDLRGRGKSEGERFYVENFSDYLGDVDKLVRIARSENPGLPVYVLGHSVGGVIASSYVFEHQPAIAGTDMRKLRTRCRGAAPPATRFRRRQSPDTASASLFFEE